ncbi:MAG TPA: type II secretion system protein N [Burkholderiaceae bacterium]|nr:type II secretion system protein N [Burkholderiaceae bacterium]
MQARVLAFLIWAGVAASAMFWLLRLTAWSPAAPAHTVAVAPAAAPRGDLTRVLGAAPVTKREAAPEPALAARFRLLGVAAPRQGGDREGLALIAIDGKPARGYKVGAALDGELTLLSVHPRGAAIGERGGVAKVTLELPALPPPATGRPATMAPSPMPGMAGAVAVPPPAVVPVMPPPAVPSPSGAEGNQDAPQPAPAGALTR